MFAPTRKKRPSPYHDPEEEAACLIQSSWRGHRDMKDFEQRRARAKPWGWFTHTLALTYVSPFAAIHSSKRMMYLLLEDPGSSSMAQGISVVIVATIVLSVVGFILETVPEVYDASPVAWFVLEVVCTLVFTAEYGCRLAVCDQARDGEGSRSRSPHLNFILAPMNLFDLMAVLPFYIEVTMIIAGLGQESALTGLRVVRLVRVIRMFKLGRYATGLRLMGKALVNSSQAISVLVFLTLVGVVLFSSALFNVEQLSCPDRGGMSTEDALVYDRQCADRFYRGVSQHGLCCQEVDEDTSVPVDFPSIIAATWWSMVTMTSVGYGEVYPKTTLGKCVGCVAMLAGMVLIALPVAIMGQKFQDVYETHDLTEAKLRGHARMQVRAEVWSLAPTSDVVARLRRIEHLGPELADAVEGFSTSLEEAWEQREQLGRARKLEISKHGYIYDKVEYLLSNTEPVLAAVREQYLRSNESQQGEEDGLTP